MQRMREVCQPDASRQSASPQNERVLNVCPAAFLVFFPAVAGTGIVAAYFGVVTDIGDLHFMGMLMVTVFSVNMGLLCRLRFVVH
jgi:hypothetical protein